MINKSSSIRAVSFRCRERGIDDIGDSFGFESFDYDM